VNVVKVVRPYGIYVVCHFRHKSKNCFEDVHLMDVLVAYEIVRKNVLQTPS